VRLRRLIVFALVVAVHTAALLFFPSLRRQLTASDEAPSMILFFPVAPKSREEAPPPQTPQRDARAHRLPAPVQRTPPPQPNTPPPPAAIDWAAEAEITAANRIAADEAAARQATALKPRHSPIDMSGSAKTLGFHWYQARIHRVETIPGGGILIHINDRCAIVVPIMFMTFCKIGEIKTRDDLFQHMGDPAAEEAPSPPMSPSTP
jgi:hypothetical protein